jgi:hypothetical protein
MGLGARGRLGTNERELLESGREFSRVQVTHFATFRWTRSFGAVFRDGIWSMLP